METLKIVNTELPPCSLTATPVGTLVGTYELNKETGNRTGSLDIYNADLELQTSARTDSAILDTKYVNGRIYSATSTGKVCLYNSDLVEQQTIEFGDGLVTQMAINNETLALTMTTGELVVYDLNSETETFRNNIHELEAWTVELGGPAAPHNVYTGGDDRVLSLTDLRMNYTLWKVKPHEAGVTSILRRDNDILWTGGYDDCLNEFDLRTRRVKDSADLGGGVWRLLESPDRSRILACCMYGGLQILDPTELGKVHGSLTNHESMVYGGLWLNDTEGITCSFYDKMLQKWRV